MQGYKVLFLVAVYSSGVSTSMALASMHGFVSPDKVNVQKKRTESPENPEVPPTPVKKLKQVARHPRPVVDVVAWDKFQNRIPLGEGLSGEVWGVQEDGQPLVLKVRKEKGLTPVRAEFQRLQQAAVLGVAPAPLGDIFRIGTQENHFFAFRMEQIPGVQTLGSALKSIRSDQNKEKVRRFSTIADRAFSSLEALHSGNLTHNDLSPENILVAGDVNRSETIQRVVLIDFGTYDDDVGHPEYHLLESLQFNDRRDLDFVALILVFLEASGNYIPNSDQKLTLSELIAELPNMSIFSAELKTKLIERLSILQTEIELKNSIEKSFEDRNDNEENSRDFFEDLNLFNSESMK